jgi:hypothetical protein
VLNALLPNEQLSWQHPIRLYYARLTHLPTTGLQQFYNSVTTVLQQCYNSVTTVLQQFNSVLQHAHNIVRAPSVLKTLCRLPVSS